MERSVEVVTAIVGILKAEAAYLPLDSRAPAERLRWMIEDSGAAAVIVDRQLAGLAASLKTTARVIALDDIPNEETGPPPCSDALAAISERLVYVIYTS
jgi:non-ribosomal peptide synthetase component F